MAEISRSAKTKLIAIIVLSVTTFSFGVGFFTFLGLEFFGPEPVIETPEEITLIEQDMHIEGTFNRAYNESSQQISFLVPFALYYHFRIEVNREIPYPSFVRPDSVRFVAEYIRDHVDYPDDDECVIRGILSFVQDRGPNNASMKYIYDAESSGAKFPIETLCEGGGDCEDSAIFFLSLAKALGYEVVICYSPNHAFAAIKMESPPVHTFDRNDYYTPFYLYIDGDFYYTCECTGYWAIGHLPSSIPPVSITWEPVPYQPQ
ncbi:MAG: hypothetical protein JW776_14545 [Candidatus Lokiarchaeota archaeon]|nr:hypothetical protein [Candidatus Lokiarchaeota archaeon]